MKQLCALVLLMPLVAATATAAAAKDYRELEAVHELAPGQAVHLDFPAGDLEIEAGPEGRVAIELEIECKWGRNDCEDLLDDAEVVWRSRERRLFVEIEGLATWRLAKVEVTARLEMPARAALDVEMAAGRLVIDGLANDVRVQLGAGEVQIWLAESAVESVAVDVGVGDARFHSRSGHVSGRRSMLIGSEVYWDNGQGKARIDVELGAGEATVSLD